MKKRLFSAICLLTAFGAVLVPPAVSAASETEITVTVNGGAVAFPDQPPVQLNDRVYVPVRFVAERLGAVVRFEEDTQTVYITRGGAVLLLQIGNPRLWLNDGHVDMDVEPLLLGDRTVIPIRFVAEEEAPRDGAVPEKKPDGAAGENAPEAAADKAPDSAAGENAPEAAADKAPDGETGESAPEAGDLDKTEIIEKIIQASRANIDKMNAENEKSGLRIDLFARGNALVYRHTMPDLIMGYLSDVMLGQEFNMDGYAKDFDAAVAALELTDAEIPQLVVEFATPDGEVRYPKFPE
jgi:hypothetical protein